jgi:hypothetical protein
MKSDAVGMIDAAIEALEQGSTSAPVVELLKAARVIVQFDEDCLTGEVRIAPNEVLRDGLKRTLSALGLAIFVIKKQGVMPNSSWETGFMGDMEHGRTALLAGGAMIASRKRDRS